MRYFIIFLLSSTCFGQTVEYRGRIYADDQICCNNSWCDMYQDIMALRRQIRQRRSVSSEYRVETRTRLVPSKLCNGRICEYMQETYQVKVPIKREAFKKRLVCTPINVVEAILKTLNISKSSKYVDVGCGDGRYLVKAVELFGCKATGLENNQDTVRLARKKIRTAKMSSEIEILCINADQYDYSEVNYVTMWLHPDTMKSVIDRLVPGTWVASYMHKFPSTITEYDTYEGELDGKHHVFYITQITKNRLMK